MFANYYTKLSSLKDCSNTSILYLGVLKKQILALL